MRRIIIFVVLVLAATISYAQTQLKAGSRAHLTFMEIPIDGSLSAFVSKMEKNGFTKVGSEDGYALLVGEYASRKNSMVAIETLKQEDVVSKIAVMFTPWDTWSALSNDYYSLKSSLTEKYGTPSDHAEKFHIATPADDIAKMNKVKSGDSEYYTTFETPGGSIQLSIEHDRGQKCFVQLAFYDKINGEDM